MERITVECKNADTTPITIIPDATQSTGHSATTTVTDTMAGTGHSATIDDHQLGIDPMDDLIASIESFEVSKKFKAYIPPTWPKKQDMYVGLNTSPERYLENLWLFGRAWVQKVKHVARLTLNSPNGPIWPTEVEPMALALFDFLKGQRLPLRYWANIPDRADFADELDFVWRVNPPWLPPDHQEIFAPLWEYLTGMARTWSWNWHNEARKHGAPEAVWRRNDRKPRSRFYTNKSSAARHHHVLAQQRVPTIAQYIRTNKFYQVGDDETSCKRPQSSPRCRDKCHHTNHAHTLKKLKKKKTRRDSRSRCPAGERIRRHRMNCCRQLPSQSLTTTTILESTAEPCLGRPTDWRARVIRPSHHGHSKPPSSNPLRSLAQAGLPTGG